MSAVAVRWEYRVANFAGGSSWDEIEAWLNAAGADGWEMVSTDVERNPRLLGAPRTVVSFMKRAVAA